MSKKAEQDLTSKNHIVHQLIEEKKPIEEYFKVKV